MGKILLVYVLFVVVASATLDMVNKENASKHLSDSSIMFSGLKIVLIMSIVITIIITHINKVLLIVVYKLHDLYTTYRQMSCATLKLNLVGMLLLIYF